MLTCLRYLILAVLYIILTVMNSQKASAAPENQVQEVQNASVDVEEDASRNSTSTCLPPGQRCRKTCDCCQYDRDRKWFECLRHPDGVKYCVSTHLPPLPCPPRVVPCTPVDGVCAKACDCCQKDKAGKPQEVTCFKENNSTTFPMPEIETGVGKCYAWPILIVDCSPLIPAIGPYSKRE